MIRPQVVVYLADWSFSAQMPARDAYQIDQVNYAFGHIRHGQVSISHLKRLDQLARLRAAFPHLRVLLSVGGWGADGFSQAIETADGRDRLAGSALALVDALRLDGIDWDWEYPGVPAAGIGASEHDRDRFADFLLLMRGRLDAYGASQSRHLLQTAAVGAGQGFAAGYDLARAGAALDTINLMTYDMGRDTTCHVTNLYASAHAHYSTRQAVTAWHKAGARKAQLLIGGTFYYHIFEGVDAPPPGLSAPFIRKGSGGAAEAWGARLAGEGSAFREYWDEDAQAAVYYDGHTLLSGDVPRSMLAKGRFIAREKLGGIIIWEYNHDRSGAMLAALRRGIREGA